MAEHLTTHSAIISFAFSFIDATAETLDSLEPILVVFSFTKMSILEETFGHCYRGGRFIGA